VRVDIELVYCTPCMQPAYQAGTEEWLLRACHRALTYHTEQDP
jgi:hypothetical protein